MCIYKCMLNVYKNQQNRQTGSRNLMGPKMLPTIWGTYMKLVTKYQISAINSCWEKCDEKWAYMLNVYENQQSQQTGSRNLMGPKTPTIGVPIWSLWPNIRFLPSIVAEKNVMKNVHICSMCIKTNCQQTGSRNMTGPKTIPTIWYTYMTLVTKYQISAINSYREKCDKKYLGWMEGRTEVKQYTPLPLQGTGI